MAMRQASIAMLKQSDEVAGATTATGAALLRPNMTCSRSPCSGLVGVPVLGAGDAGGELPLGHVVVLGEHLRRLAVVVAGLERKDVGLGDLRVAAEALLDELDRRVERPAVEPEHEAEGEHVLRAGDLLGGEAGVAQGALVRG